MFLGVANRRNQKKKEKGRVNRKGTAKERKGG